MPFASSDSTTGRRVLAVLLTTLFAVVVLRSAWMHDDAYITFRTVDNYVNGYGLRWNIAERVQTYTHPLWMFVVSACYFVTHEMFFTVIAVSVALTAGTVLLLLFGVAPTLAAGGFAVTTLAFSKAFVDYSTSGLENPLTHFLYALWLVVFFRADPDVTTLHSLASIAALGAVNRLDSVLLYLPALAFVLTRVPRASGLAVLAAGFLPLVAWQAFSLFYYGFPFPNTAYAKLFEAGVGQSDRVLRGVNYLLSSVRADPVTALAIGCGLGAGAWSADRRNAAVVGGVGAYLAYIVYIGGDFVTGRFLSAPLLGAVVVLSRWRRMPSTTIALAIGGVFVVGLSASDPPLLRTASAGLDGAPPMDAHGIADERAYYYPYTGLLRALQGVTVASHPWSLDGLDARRRRLPLAVRGDIGFFGFHAGPQVHVVDVWGIADPLIARLPASHEASWRTGHFTRTIPRGYPETLTSGRNQIADPAIAAQYDRLALVTRGPLLAPRRLLEIWKINLGR